MDLAFFKDIYFGIIFNNFCCQNLDILMNYFPWPLHLYLPILFKDYLPYNRGFLKEIFSRIFAAVIAAHKNHSSYNRDPFRELFSRTFAAVIVFHLGNHFQGF